MIDLRALKLSDLPRVLEISEKVPGGERWPKINLHSEFAQAETWGLFQNDQLISFVFFRRTVDHLEITWLASAPEFFRQGHMNKLLTKLIDANSQKLPIWLEVRGDNRQA